MFCPANSYDDDIDEPSTRPISVARWIRPRPSALDPSFVQMTHVVWSDGSADALRGTSSTGTAARVSPASPPLPPPPTRALPRRRHEARRFQQDEREDVSGPRPPLGAPVADDGLRGEQVGRDHRAEVPRELDQGHRVDVAHQHRCGGSTAGRQQ